MHFRYEAVTVNKLNFLFYYQNVRVKDFFTQNILSAWRATDLVSYNSDVVISKLSRSKTFSYVIFINENEIQINVSVTFHTVIRINEIVNAILSDMTSSLHARVLDLKNTVLTAVTNRKILQRTNQKLLNKQQ